MTEETFTTDSILNRLAEMAASTSPIDPFQWLNACTRLVGLVGDESNLLFQMEHHLAELRAAYLEQGMTSAKARQLVEALPEYVEARKQKAKIERIYEMVRISKLRSKLGMEEYKAN